MKCRLLQIAPCTKVVQGSILENLGSVSLEFLLFKKNLLLEDYLILNISHRYSIVT